MNYFVEYDVGGELYTMDLIAPSLEDAEQQARSKTTGTIMNVRPYTASLRQARVLRTAANVVRYTGSIVVGFLMGILLLETQADTGLFVLLTTSFLVSWMIVILLTFVLTGIAGLPEHR